ncbi:polysaccharide lyase family 7 protein [Shewanella sp. TC10]|uniref:polysaccharide lyase family 7 protein n=1 Tax=Shewanella sp. TC10 TaxID=1419739 RepID=UPI00129DC05D|nr:polysaccharide lyase family 7 protein [Shewanella sp. TC10]
MLMRVFISNVLLILLLGCSGSSDSPETPPELPPETPPEVPPCETCNWTIEQWKLTIPESKDSFYGSGGTSAAELKPSTCSNNQTLSNDTDIAYFWTETNPLQLVFNVDLGMDGATTPNTQYVRSELRELYRFDTENPCSATNQNWTISGKHQLEASVNIIQYPQITSVSPKVIVGQVHGKDIKQALVKVLWEGSEKPVRVILNDSFKPDNQTCDSCQPFSIELGTAKAYEDWQYAIEVDTAGITLTTIAAGISTQKLLKWGEPVIANDGKEYTLDTAWLNEEYYFKAGIYPQIVTSSDYAGQVFEVGFTELKVTHAP